MSVVALKEDNRFATQEYTIGDRDERVWGWYEVTNVGTMDSDEEFCEKRIGILPRQALSLQRHHGRRELWTAVRGTLTVIVNGELHEVHEGESIHIPLHAPHCMVNMSHGEIVVYEKQMGVCREEDNDRLFDMAGREIVEIAADDAMAHKSVELYKKIIQDLGN
jgi:mannose-6-phosphate isomerase-like protein (cupin superfamily)